MNLPCPNCGDADARIRLHLDTCKNFSCQECDNEFTEADIQTFIKKWSAILRWTATMPTEATIQ